jgi:hypothetical protein
LKRTHFKNSRNSDAEALKETKWHIQYEQADVRVMGKLIGADCDRVLEVRSIDQDGSRFSDAGQPVCFPVCGAGVLHHADGDLAHPLISIFTTRLNVRQYFGFIMRLSIGCYICAGVVGIRGGLRDAALICVRTKNASDQRGDYDWISPKKAQRLVDRTS